MIVDHLNKNDINLVCGMIPSLIAFNSNKPYFIMPHGSDIRLALGFSKSKKASILKRIIPSKLELGLNKRLSSIKMYYYTWTIKTSCKYKQNTRRKVYR